MDLYQIWETYVKKDILCPNILSQYGNIMPHLSERHLFDIPIYAK